MNDLCAGVQILSLSGKRDAGEFHFGTSALQNAHGVQIGDVGTERAGNPLDLTALFHQRTFGVQVVHILRPVLDGGVAQGGVLAHEQFHTSGVQIGNVVLRSGTSFDEVQVCALFHNDQRVLKLSGALSIQTEIRLQRNGNRNALGNVYERTAGPYSTVKCSEFMVGGRNQLHEVLPDHLRILAVHSALQIGVDNALVGNLLPYVVVY